MTKTCYFCTNSANGNPYYDSESCNHCGDAYNGFVANKDWLEYEALKKENEELKSLIKLMKCTRITS